MGEKGGLCKNIIFDFFFLSWENVFQTAMLSSTGKAEEELRGHWSLCAGGLAGGRAQATRTHIIDCLHRKRGSMGE